MMRRTGKGRFRGGWFGKLILELEWAGTEPQNNGNHISMEDRCYWRDAKPVDLMELTGTVFVRMAKDERP